MRRRGVEPLPSWAEVETRLGAARAGEERLVRASFPLRAITPVVGGGSATFEPDPAEPVRLPEVRGSLRWWWRALFHGDQGAEALFLEEARLWGGVDVPTGNGREAERSRVGLDLRVREPGTLAAAGTHEIGENGKPKAAASWQDERLRYGLFPLQRSEDERREHVRRGHREPLPTRRVRTGLAFDLDVTITETDPERVQQVLVAIWTWIRLGGLGARTRRGFGALELAGPVEAVDGDLDPPLAFSAGEIEAEWRRLQALAVASSRLGQGARLLLGPEEARASAAHGKAVELLRTFRQGGGCGRRQGHGNRPGHSNWPEADHMRRLAGIAPRDPVSAEDETAEWGAPRAAFGLPLQIKFKDDADDGADANLVPTVGGRWSSPLILRPVATGRGRYRPMALFLAGEGPAEVVIEERGKTLPVRKAAGAKQPIRPLLDRTGGDALRAFGDWLVSRQGFVAVNGGGGPRR